MGGKFFDSSYRESSVKNKLFRQSGAPEPQPRHRRHKNKILKLEYLEEDWLWSGYSRWYKRMDGCWELFPCSRTWDKAFHWSKVGSYEKLRDAKNALAGQRYLYSLYNYALAWRITKDGELIEGGMSDCG